jgi:hypothetical protein
MQLEILLPAIVLKWRQLMAAMTNLLVKDDTTTTRVEITFVPVTDTPKPFWRAQISGVPFEGQPTIEMDSTTLKSGDRKFAMKLDVPVMETLGASGTSAGYVAPPAVAYTNTYYVSAVMSKRSTTSDRANALSLIVGILQGATSTTATGTLDQASAADAFKSSTAPGPVFFTQGSLPF